MRAVFLVVALAVTTGCNKDVDVADDASGPVTWHKDMQPLIMEHCGRCHDGVGIGPGDFTDYDVASSMADLMVARMAAGEMPPRSADPECADYDGSERMNVTDSEFSFFERWAEAGAPEGNASAASAELFVPSTIANPSVVSFTSANYEPQYEDKNNEYRCFLLDYSPESDVFLTAIEPIIDQVNISHHSLLFMDPTGTASNYITDPSTQSWSCPQVFPLSLDVITTKAGRSSVSQPSP